MKSQLLIAAALLLCLASSARAADDWTREDTYRQATFTALMIADWSQTRWAIRHPDRYWEMNKVLGGHTTQGRLNNYTALGIAGHAAVSVMLPPEWRKGWQYVWIGIEAHAVYRNNRVGVKFDF